MAAPPPELSQEAVLRFLAERGGRARNAELLECFGGFLNCPEPERRAQARQGFKEMVNAVATVRQEAGSGAKYVQLRKKYRSALAAGTIASHAPASSPQTEAAAAGTQQQPEAEDGGGGGSHRLEEGAAHGVAPLREETKEEEEEEEIGDPAATSEAEPLRGADEEPPLPSVASSSSPEAFPPSGSEVPQPSQSAGDGGAAAASSSPRTAGGEEAEEEEEEGEMGGEAPSECLPSSVSLSAGLGNLAASSNTPRSGRKAFRERVLGSSPQLKRGGALSRGSGGSRGGGDSDSASLASSSAEEEGGGGGSGALDPLEHAWMLCASDGRWESLEGLLSCEPALLSKRDFITGFTCLHWAAKHGRHELLALLVNFAHRHRLPVNVNARTSGGYTALHLAAMHGHLEVVKLLVGAYDADVEVRDYSGRKASHYLGHGTAEEVRGLVGALQDEADGGAPNGGGRWRLSKVLPANLITYRLPYLHHGDEGESGDGAATAGRGKELSRKTSGSGRIKPRINKIRFRTQIIHTTPSFRGETEEGGQEEKPRKASFKLRPKSNVFG